jgi:diaminopimelate epimerase
MSDTASPPAAPDRRAFIKMHGLGNDFVLLDRRGAPGDLPDARTLARLADRRLGIGCDQVLILVPGDADTDVGLLIHNPDGGEAEACGNGTRCAAALVMAETGATSLAIATRAGRLGAETRPGGRIAVDMGVPLSDWQAIPLAAAVDVDRLPLAAGRLGVGAAVGMGNPHVVFFVPDAEAIDLMREAAPLETDPLFPARTNVEVVTVLDRARLRMRVWERGAGVTRACGSGACAAVVAAHRRGLADRRATVVLDGGELEIDWHPDGHVWMTGPAETVFTGRLDAGS